MAIDHKALAQALRTLDEAPKKIAQAKQRYSQTLADIKAEEAKGIWSPKNIQERRERAKAERDRIAKSLGDSMVTAFGVVKANNNYDSEDLRLDDPKLTNAFNIINAMGKNVPHSTQISILNQFRGNISALKVLEGAYKQNGLYFASLAQEMQKPISSQALSEMEHDLATYQYNAQKGIYDFENKYSFWSKNVYAEQAQRMGYDLENVADPFEYALVEMKRKLDNDSIFVQDIKAKSTATAQRMVVDQAIYDISVAKKTGADESAVFDSAIRRVQRFKDTPQNNA